MKFASLYISIILVGLIEGADLDKYIFNLLQLTRIPTIYLLINVMKLISKSYGSHNALLIEQNLMFYDFIIYAQVIETEGD